MGTLAKRHRENEIEGDRFDQSTSGGSNFLSPPLIDETTPRAPRQYGRLFQDLDHDTSSTLPASASKSQTSSRSKASSPSEKQSHAALEDETGHDIFSFAQHDNWQPNVLKTLKSDLHRIQRGNRVAPTSLITPTCLIANNALSATTVVQVMHPEQSPERWQTFLCIRHSTFNHEHLLEVFEDLRNS